MISQQGIKNLVHDVQIKRQREIRDMMKKKREKAVLVDRISRWLFPTSFILLNIVYWALFGDHELWWFICVICISNLWLFKEEIHEYFCARRTWKNVAMMILCQWFLNKIPQHDQIYGMKDTFYYYYLVYLFWMIIVMYMDKMRRLEKYNHIYVHACRSFYKSLE